MKLELLTRNKKMRKSSDRIFNFTLPALRTCPNAGACAVGCYSTQGAYVFSNVKPKHERNFDATKTNEFIGRMVLEVRKSRANVIRIHDAGDFYNREYMHKWFRIMEACPDVKFYAYTKMVNMFKQAIEMEHVPDNFTVIFSYGGKQDGAIDPDKDRHSQVFKHEDDLVRAGYVNASHDDMLALTPNKRVGLVYHGAKSKNWGK